MSRYLDPKAIRQQAELFVEKNVRNGSRKDVAEVLFNAYMEAKFSNLKGEKFSQKRSEVLSETVNMFGRSTSDGNYDEFAITKFSVELAKLKFKA